MVLDPAILFPDDVNLTHRNARDRGNGTRSIAMSVNTALSRLKEKADSKRTFAINSPDELKVAFDHDATQEENCLGMRGHMYFEPDRMKGGDVTQIPLSDIAIRTACAMQNLSPYWYKTNLDEDIRFDRFRENFHDVLSHNHGDQGIRMRVETFENRAEVDAVLPHSFNPIPDAELISQILEGILGNYGDDSVAGIEGIFGENKGTVAFRIVLSDALIDGDVNDNRATMPMLSYLSNEYGLTDSRIDFGIWQVICWNGWLHQLDFIQAQWNHCGTEDRFIDRIRNVTMHIQHFCPIAAQFVRDKAAEPLEMEPAHALRRLRNLSMIDERLFKMALEWHSFHDIETAWDLGSLLTDCAKYMNPLANRQKAEANVSCIMHWKGGINKLLESGSVSRKEKNRVFSKDGVFSPMAKSLKDRTIISNN